METQLTEKEKLASALQTSAIEPRWVAELRKSALENFRNLDYPTPDNEEWKYTNLTQLLAAKFRFPDPKASSIEAECRQGMLSNTEPHAVFVDGRFDKELSRLEGSGLEITDLKEALLSDESLGKHFSRYAVSDNAFSAFNTAFFSHGALIRAKSSASKPLYVLHLSTQEGILTQPRLLYIGEPNSKATVLEYFMKKGKGKWYLVNAVNEIVLGEGAELHHYKIQDEDETSFHVYQSHVELSRSSRFHSFTVDRGGKMARNTLKVKMAGEGAECDLNGLYVTRGAQHVDNCTVIDHASPHAVSRQLYKGIVGDKSSAVFYGKIFVRKDAQKTDATQKNKNLLLSDGAKVDTRPQLEISADDVKCAHGAAIGQLSDEELFYLKSRGIGEERARAILTFAFAAEIAERMEVESVKHEMREFLSSRFGEGVNV